MALEIKKIDKFIYPGTHRETIEGKRHYVIGEEKLPSVTTILAATPVSYTHLTLPTTSFV